MPAQSIWNVPSRGTASEGWVALLLFALAVVGVAYSISPSTAEDAAVVTAVVGFVSAGVMILRYGRRTLNDDARSFRLIGMALILGGTGMISFAIVDQFIVVPAFGVMDSVFFVMYGLLLASLAFMPSVKKGWRRQTRILLDGLVGGISLAVLGWQAFGDQIIENLSMLPTSQRLIGLAYPVFDLSLLIGVMVVVLRRGQYRFDVRLVALCLAFAFQVAADLSYVLGATNGLFEDAEPNMLLFLSSSLFFVVAAALIGRVPAPVESADRKTPLWAYAAPYGIAVVLVAITIWQDFVVGDHSAVLTVATFVVGMLVIARQWLAIQENRVLVEKERRSLIASVSHELRTPLTSMIGFLTLLEDADSGVSEEEQAELRGVVLDQANYMGRMVTDIILLARDQPEKLSLIEQPIPAVSFVDGILDTLGAKVSDLVIDVDDDMVLTIDTDRVRQVATNLLNNAERYGDGGTALVISNVEGDLVIEVHDNGSGVPKKYEHTIWERFERGPHKLNSAKPGTGLGLAIVEMIAKAHQGTVGYRTSERLGGACFFVRLPGRVSAPDGGVEAAELTSAWQPASVRSR